ncbi:MAG: hypothetical protein KAU50_05180, partial [Candidatus Marinimicrobia bacterium]|nr:hypothetical protein [Candidatus Neomarinimicrobiota bacterium]
LKAGDSLRVVTALGIGSDPDSGGVHSLVKLIEIMERAQLVMDVDFQLETLIDAPPAPVVEVEEWVVDGRVTGIKVIWDETPSLHQNFEAFKVWKSSGKTSAGAYDWQPLGLGTYTDTAGSASWPPPAGDQAGTYQVVHEGVLNGMDYYYSVQTISSEITEPIYAGVIETNKLDEASFKGISPSNPVASTLANVRVVPNPYRGSLSWNNPSPSDAFPWQHRLQFTNLPGDAKIKIFTVAGDFIAEVVAGSAVRQGGATTISPSLSVAEWDLMTRNNQEAAPGIYLYVVDSKSLGSKVGKFVIIR